MNIRIYYLRGENYIPGDDDFICVFNSEEVAQMKPAFDVLKVRTGFDIISDSKTDLNLTSVGALIEAIYDLVPHQKKEKHIKAIDQLNEIAQTARKKGLGLALYREEQ